MKFSVGDEIVIVKIWQDLHIRDSKIGERGTIKRIGGNPSQPYLIEWELPNMYGTWWVHGDSIALAEERPPHYHVIQKIKAIREKRLSLGYKY
jgi:hypothetical protein